MGATRICQHMCVIAVTVHTIRNTAMMTVMRIVEDSTVGLCSAAAVLLDSDAFTQTVMETFI